MRDAIMAENKLEFDPRDHIDRNAEQELFRDLVSFTSTARMLTICDKGARGKSSLLKRLQYNCKYEMKPSVPACMVALDQLEDISHFELIKKIHEELKGVTFPKFDKLNNARMANDFAPFELRTFEPRNRISVEGPVEREAMVVAEYTHTVVEQGDVIIVKRFPPLSADQQTFAQNKCIEAFFEDLRVICATQPIVLLFDAWERCNLQLREWITDELLRNHCFNPDENLRPANLAIVLASRPHGKEQRHGLRDDEFIRLFADAQEYAAVVLSRTSLSDWDADHVRAFLDQHGIINVDDAEINFIRDSLKKGRSLFQILNVAEALTAE
jgi:hypothetical protein